jgi:hypothetical protein
MYSFWIFKMLINWTLRACDLSGDEWLFVCLSFIKFLWDIRLG